MLANFANLLFVTSCVLLAFHNAVALLLCTGPLSHYQGLGTTAPNGARNGS